jgi:regulator of ribonuclease activity A
LLLLLLLLLLQALEGPGEGRVLVVAGGGALRCALVGDALGELGVKNGWKVRLLLFWR